MLRCYFSPKKCCMQKFIRYFAKHLVDDFPIVASMMGALSNVARIPRRFADGMYLVLLPAILYNVLQSLLYTYMLIKISGSGSRTHNIYVYVSRSNRVMIPGRFADGMYLVLLPAIWYIVLQSLL